MLNEKTLEAMHAALVMRGNSQDESNPAKAANDEALRLVEAFQSGDAIASLWWVDDVCSLRRDDEGEATGEITLEQARAVLKMADDEHDATIGINWDVLEAHLDSVLNP